MKDNVLKYIAHKTEDGLEQSIIAHLQGTAQLAGEFASRFGFAAMAEEMGMCHDIGKYSNAFQKRIRDGKRKVDHSTAGGKEICKLNPRVGLLMAYGIMGHHGGLPDGGNRRSDIGDDGTLRGRLKREVEDYMAFLEEIELKGNIQIPQQFAEKCHGDIGFSLSFLIRMLFSCLVDADYLDTERFMSNDTISRGGHESIKNLLIKLEQYIQRWEQPLSEIAVKRNNILQCCIEKASSAPGMYTLTVPTGGGKTISSLAFALHHAAAHSETLCRIIYVIPFTSIIEQNAKVFEEVLGEENVLAHHSNITYDREDDEEAEKKRLAVENWDAPVIVTTNVQFFESLFSNKPGKCRKLHRIAGSVIIFDEAQMLPLQYLKPCMRAMEELVRNYRCTAVLCTATQPSLEKFMSSHRVVTEICENTNELYTFFRRVTLKDLKGLEDEQLVVQLKEQDQVLCIVNSRKQAQSLFEEIGETEGNYHLSTYMAPVHRTKVLNLVRDRLRENKTCRLIATSLVEAGVDVDFPCVYRARAGLDSIIQAAGRANREGKRSAEESFVYIFDAEEKYVKNYPTFIQTGKDTEKEVAQYVSDIMSPQAIQRYFDTLHEISGKELDAKEILVQLERDVRHLGFPFKKVAADFRLIDQNTKMLLIPCHCMEPHGVYNQSDKTAEIAEKLKEGIMSRKLLREAGMYAVNIYERQYMELYKACQLYVIDDEIAILIDETIYSSHVGLKITSQEGRGIFL